MTVKPQINTPQTNDRVKRRITEYYFTGGKTESNPGRSITLQMPAIIIVRLALSVLKFGLFR